MRFAAAMMCAACVFAIAAPAAQAEFGLLNPDVTFTTATGAAEMQAGSHPFATSVSFQFARAGEGKSATPDGTAKDVIAELPPGFIGNPTAAPRCTGVEFATITKSISQPACPDSSALGLVTVEIKQFGLGGQINEFTVPVYDLAPSPGSAVKLGFVVFNVPVTIEGGLSQVAPYRVRSGATNITQAVPFFASKLILWGDPSSPTHDAFRGHCVKAAFVSVGGVPQSLGQCPFTGEQKTAFITLPSSCRGPQTTLLEVDSWERPGPPFLRYEVPTNDVGSPPQTVGFSGCERIGFSPVVSNKPTTSSAESPSGLNFSLDIEGNQGLTDPSEEALADSDIEKAVVTLPQGVTTNPSVATGLAACTLAQYDAQKLGGEGGCPEASKIGTVEIESPVLEDEVGGEGGEDPQLAPHVLRGSIYVAHQHDNVFDNLLTIYMVIEDPKYGVFIKLPGRVEPDPATGQLKTTFGEPGFELPQLPFSHFRLHFREGRRAPLITPPTCGTFSTEAVLYPYADPAHPHVQTATFEVNSGAEGSPCASQPSQLPSKQSFSAGTVDPKAGTYSPFVLKLSRPDGSQLLRSISTTLPEGLLGKLAGIPYCSEAQIVQAQSRSGEGQGAVELANPSCPRASEVGTVVASAGAGPEPLYVTGHAYLAGPYAGAPLSLEIITPAIAGPFDLGVVAVRTALQVDPFTALITAVSDPIPPILHGLPLDLRSIAVNVSRPNFMLNPTSCEPKAITGSATTTLAAVTPLNQYFQTYGCGSLKYKPTFKLQLIGATRRSGHPALKAVVTVPHKSSYANTARLQVGLPHSEFLDQGNLDKVCTQPQLRTATCPKRSVYGHVKVWTPLVEKPLQGNVYIGVGFGHQLPDLVTELNGQVRVLLHGRVDTTKHEGLRNTFEFVPDAPYSRVVVQLKGGKKYGLLENSENICSKPQQASVLFVSQTGIRAHSRPTITNSCRTKKEHHTKSHGHAKHHR
jgi:hypothetical protein